MKLRGVPLALFMVVLVPCILFSVLSMNRKAYPRDGQYPTESERQMAQLIRVWKNGKVSEMELDSYIVGVLLGELPNNFEPDTLKAQAVAARTYTLRSVSSTSSKHENADVCTDHTCCQAYVDPQDYDNGEFLRKIRSTVEETSGQVLMYRENLIEATYFSCSGGRTEAAVAVWGTDIPYLQSVASPGEEAAKYYEHSTVISREEFLSLLGLPENLLIYEDSLELTYTDGGGVAQMVIGDAQFSGVQLRTLLNLRSTAFTLEFSTDSVLITTKGNGHRVGMSQYGADAMALDGYSYSEILLHYYPGTELVTLSPEQLQPVFDKA